MRDPPRSRVEVVYESDRTRVTREYLDGRTVIRKEPLGPDARDRFRHESAMLDRLRGVDGVVQLATAPSRPGSIVLEDVDGVCMAGERMPLNLSLLSRLALDLARAVAGVHRRGIVHRDIQPGNIVVSRTHGAPYLVDFALSTTFAEIHPELTPHSEIVGNLAYLAPEQTGRTGRPADRRADLYALGATFYELATGQPPFGTSDPLSLSHDHLARVPAPPHRVNPDVPPTLSEIIMHLLEKEPDRRYQTADGLVYDLGRLSGTGLDAVAPRFPIGERDFPLRLVAPPHLVGRQTEIAALGGALADAASGGCRAALVSGGPGVGKSALIDQLRPIVTANDGWLVAGRFDRYRNDQEFDAVWQCFRSLGRLMLAEPDEELVELRERLLDVLGADVGLMVAVQPSYQALLGVAPDSTVGNPLSVEARLIRMAADVLRVVASRKRPLVFVVDDLQWAARTPLGFVDTILQGEVVEGLMLVGAYREDEVDASHPLAAMLSRWRQRPEALRLRLDNLTPSNLTQMVGEMLLLDAVHVAPLAEAIEPYTKGNPYDTVALLNVLRRDQLLTPSDGEWRWDPVALQHRLGRADLDVLVAERAAAMPPQTVSLLRTMACLGGRISLSVLQVAIDASASAAEQRLAPAIEDGLLVMEPGGTDPTVRFHHDHVQQVILSRMGQQQLHALRLRIARRLARTPELFAAAAEQYLPVIEDIGDADERARVAALLTRAADQAQLVGNHSVVERCLAAAARLTDPADSDTLIRLLTGRHTALYTLGRLDETDETFRAIGRLCTNPEQRTQATILQVSSLSTRGYSREAVELGFAQLQKLGLRAPPPERLDAEIEHGAAAMSTWLDETSAADDLRRSETTNPAVPTVAPLINRMLQASLAYDPAVMAWLALESMRLWIEHGATRELIGPMSYLVFVPVMREQDYRTAHRVMKRVLAVAEGRDYEPESAQASFVYAAAVGYWFDPPAENVARARRAHESLVRSGDLENACLAYYVTVTQLLESSPSLDSYVEEVEAALAFADRTGNSRAARVFSAYRHLVGALRGEGESANSDADTPQQGASFQVVVRHLIIRALTAALLGDFTDLSRHTAAVMPLVTTLPVTMQHLPLAHVLRGLALATEIRAGRREDRRALLAELDAIIAWLTARATEAPANILHWLRFIEAERAGAIGDFRTAAYAFDVAHREATSRPGHWHRALITERAARLYLAQGLEQAGRALLAAARQEYLTWGATAKVDRLDWAYPTLSGYDTEPPGANERDSRPSRRPSTTAGTIDLLGILSASQALSSETSIDRLRARVVEVASAMTGATGVQMLVWNEDERHWLVAAPRGRRMVPLADAARHRLVPLSAIRYAERTREALVVVDATQDDRFARDPYFAGMEHCSLMAVPVVNRGDLKALLLLENRLIRGAFARERLDGVMLIAAQLAVSLENAIVYASLERKVVERTEELAFANERLEQLSLTDPLTGLANRRRLEEVLDTEWRRAKAAQSPISCAMIDIDHFKLYNDHYGHAAGDRCLQRVAAQIRQSIRNVDLAARYGGEEFAVVMPGMDVKSAAKVAERMRAGILALAESHEPAADRIITVSIGVDAMIPLERGGWERLLESADAQLYRAKRSGRNRVLAPLP